MNHKLDHLLLRSGLVREEVLGRALEVGIYQFAGLKHGRSHYHLSGPKSSPLVVLIHGFSVPMYIFDPTVEALSAVGRQILRYDLYGRGFSARPNVKYDPQLFDLQLVELMESVAIKGPVDLIGLSMGGVIAALFAAKRPDLVRKAVFLDPVGFSPLLGWKDQLRLLPGIGELYWSFWGKQMLKAGLANDLARPDDYPDYHRYFESQLAFLGYKRALLSSLRQGMLNPRPQLYKTLSGLGIPTMLIWGKQDRVVPVADAQTAQNLMPCLKVHLVDQAGHIPHYERPQTVNPLLLDFLG